VFENGFYPQNPLYNTVVANFGGKSHFPSPKSPKPEHHYSDLRAAVELGSTGIGIQTRISQIFIKQKFRFSIFPNSSRLV